MNYKAPMHCKTWMKAFAQEYGGWGTWVAFYQCQKCGCIKSKEYEVDDE